MYGKLQDRRVQQIHFDCRLASVWPWRREYHAASREAGGNPLGQADDNFEIPAMGDRGWLLVTGPAR